MGTWRIRHCFFTVLLAILLTGALQSTAFGLQMTIGAVDDAGQFPGQDAYVKFVYDGNKEFPVTASDATQFTSKEAVISYADSKGITNFLLESAGNILSPGNDFIVGDALTNLPAGIYRISVVSGAFTYDSFGWSDYDEWWWQLSIQSSMLPLSVILGDTQSFLDAASALANSFGRYIDIPVNEGGSLIFWIWDWNSFDNAGSLTFDVALAPVPEPSTFIFVGTGLLLLAGRFRKSLVGPRSPY